MGRDLTPKELHAADSMFGFASRPLSLTGEGVPPMELYDPNSPFCRKFPNLGFLLGEDRAEGIPDPVLERFERHLTHIINADDSGTEPPRMCDEEVRTTMSWYRGELDRHFYYGTLNHERFVEYMRNFKP